MSLFEYSKSWSVTLPVLLAIASPALTQRAGFDARDDYDKQEHMIPMRDGVRLYTQVYVPRDTSEQYPILLSRTPYGVGSYGSDEFRNQLGPSAGFAREGYIFVYQDVRGKFRSEGEFEHHVVYKARKTGPQDVDESSDSYDTIEWLLENIPNHNGRVGHWGISYGGWQTVMGMIDPHPALRASSPQASPADQFIGDDYHHYGAFRLMYAFGWLSRNAQVRAGPTEDRTKPFEFGTPDGYQFFLDLGPISNVNKLLFNATIPTWNDFIKHETYDEYWQSKNVLKDLTNVGHSVLNVVGWFDAEDYYGPLKIYYTIEENNPGIDNILVAGPWRHGGWAGSAGDRLGNIHFGSETSRYFQEEVELPFFNYYLKDIGRGDLPEALVFETGRNEWRSYDRWPPQEAVIRELYLHGDGSLSFTPPGRTVAAEFSSFVSDPDKPVPYTAEIRTSQGHEWIVEDQRFAARRPDVLVFQSDVLDADVSIAGPIVASLNVATTGTDADWVVKLIDVYPPDSPDSEPNPGSTRMGGFQMMLAGDVFRSKFRHSFTTPEPLVPGQVTQIEFDLLDKHHTFLTGHRMMVQVQSTWFPLIDRNPQTFVDIYNAVAADFREATHRVYHTAQYPSHIKLYVMEP